MGAPRLTRAPFYSHIDQLVPQSILDLHDLYVNRLGRREEPGA